MPHVEVNQPGTFCWFELATTDSATAKPFYEQLFGWTSVDFPMGPNPADIYSIFKKDGRDAAAGYTLMEDMKQAGVPPHWLAYVLVEDVDAATRTAATLGATVTKEPFDVMDKGRMSVIADPQGATLALWQPNTSGGIGILGEHGAFAWAELTAPDVDAATTFYTKLFGWTAGSMPAGGMDYTVFSIGERPVAGLFQTPADSPVPPNWGVYWEVDDCDATVAAAQAAGATALTPTMELEGVGKMAGLTDPQGAYFSVIRSATR